jgi:hypothetical protein
VRAGRSVLRPSDADRERVLQGVLQKLDGSPPADQGMGELSRAPAVGRMTLVKVSSVLVGLGVVGAGLYLALHQPAPPASTDAARPVPPAIVPPASTPADEPRESAPSPPAPRSEARDSAAAAPRAHSPRRALPTPHSADSLAREVALVSRAGAELHAARPAAALEALDEHQRRFPSGVLAEERAAARVRALCALGRTKEAQAELTRITQAWPGSPHVARAARACASVPAKGK